MSSGFAYASGGSAHSGGSGGVLGFVKNFVHDIGDAAKGTPEGILQTVEHPIGTAEGVAKSTWQDWSPLFHGHLGQFAHQAYDHPLAPMLDIATAFTGGASVAAKLGSSLEKAGMIAGDSTLAKLGKLSSKIDITPKMAGRDSGITYTKYLPSNPIYNLGYRKLMSAAESNPLVPNWFSASKVYDRLEKVDWAHSGLALNANIAAMMKAGEVFNKAGHQDWAHLENQLYTTNYIRLVRHSPTVPLSEIAAPEPTGALKAAIAYRDRAAQVHDTLLQKEADWAKTTNVGRPVSKSLPPQSNPYRNHIVQVGHILENAQQRVDKLQARADKGMENIRPHLGGADAPGLPKGFTYIAKVDPRNLFDSPAKNVDEFGNHLGSLANKFTTTDIRKAAITLGPDGKPVAHLAHQRDLEATMMDAKNSAHFLAKLARYPTTIWKAVTLGYSPRVVVNNGVGNWLMYAMRQGGAHSLKGFVDAVRYTRGERTALDMLKQTGSLPKSHWLNEHFLDELGNTFGSSTLGGANIGKAAEAGKGVGAGVQGIYRKSFYPLVHKYADVPVRAAAISAHLRGDTLVQSLMKQGKTFDQAASLALKSNKALRDRAALHARSVAGDYTTMSGAEQAVRDFIPFYLWDKHIVKHATNMLRDRPAVVAAGSAVGQQGANETRKQLGDIPEWMIGSIPLGFHVNGRTALLNTQGMNPYSTVPDLASFAQALTTGGTEDSAGDTILGTVNPVIKGLVEHTMGVKATGAPVTNHGGVIPSTLVDIFNSLRPVQVGRAAAGLNPPPGKSPKLYHTDINTILSALVGAPIQEADLGRAVQLQKQIENNGKKPKKQRGASYSQ